MRRTALLLLVFLVLFAAPGLNAQTPNTMNTVAGGGTNSGAANTWSLTQPPAAVRDVAGNTYISDPVLCVVYRVDTAGTLSIYAGNGIFGVGGDGGPATSAGLTSPEGLALDANGNLFIADNLNNRIRRVDGSTHIITTVAGSEDPFVGAYSGDGGLAALARLNLPVAVAVDKNGNLFISDTGNNVVRRVDAQTQIITTYAGNGLPGTPGTANGDGGLATAAQLNLPIGLAVDGNDNLYIADSNDSVIRLVNATTQIITTYAGSPANQGTFGGDGGPATSAGLNTPEGIFFDGTGNLYIADTKNQRIRFVSSAGTHIITTIAGNGSLCMNPASACGDGAAATSALLNRPTGVFLDNTGKLLIADLGDQRVRVVSAGTISNFGGGASGGDGGAATGAILGLPNSLVVDPSGNLFILEQFGERVRRVDAKTHNISTYAGTGARGERLSSNGDGGQAVNANFVEGFGIAMDGPGNIFVVDEKAAVVRKIDVATKIITTVAGNGLRCGEPGNGNLPPACGDGGLATSASLLQPAGIAVDSNGNLYITDLGLNTIRIVNSSGTIQTFAGMPGTACTTYATTHCGDGGSPTQATLNGPFGVAAGPSVQFIGAIDVFFADSGNNVIRKIDGELGTISTYALDGNPGFGGDGGPATSASMTSPQQVALDDKENLYIGGGIDNVVRRVDALDQSIINVAGDIENLGGGFAGDGGPSVKALIGNLGSALDASHNLYIADGFLRIRKVNLKPVAVESGTFTAFPPTLTGTSAVNAPTQEIFFANNGLDDLILTITSPAQPSAFQIGGNCTPSGAVPCTIVVPPQSFGGVVIVSFAPAAGGPTGTLTGTLAITTNDPANPSFNFGLTGTATNTSFALKVTISPAGAAPGQVASSPTGIDCGSPVSPVCQFNFAQNSQVTLSAFPNQGFSFMGWSGAGCSGTADCVVTMTQAQSVTATFIVATGGPNPTTVSAIGNGSGTITSTPAGINCIYNGTTTSGTCSFTFPAATGFVTLTAMPTTPGSTFAGWLPFCANLGVNSCQVFAGLGLTTTGVFSVTPQPFTAGEVFAGAAGGMIFVYKPDGTLAQVLGSGNLGGNIGGLGFDASGNLYAANPSATTGSIAGTVERFGSNGSGPTIFGTGPLGTGYDASPQSVVVAPSGRVFVAQSSGRQSLLRFPPAGGQAGVEFFPPDDTGPIQWIELLDDNDTILYTTGSVSGSGGTIVKAFDIGDNIYLPDFAQNLPGTAAFGLRELPDKTVLVADGDRIVRLSTSGTVTQTYQAGTGLYHSLNLDPDGVTFWTLEDINGMMFRINIATGTVVTHFSTGIGVSLGAFNGFQGGLAVFGQPQSGGADVAVTMTAAPNPVNQNANLTYTIKVTNNGPLSAANVAMTDAFAAGVNFVSAATSVGTCSGTTSVTCNLGTMASGATATMTVIVTPTVTGPLVNTVNVTSTTPDPITINNSATTTTTVVAQGLVSLRVTMAGTAFGTVTDNLSQIGCQQISAGVSTGSCLTQYPAGTQVTLTATTPGTFAGFSGAPTACTGTGNTCQVTVTVAAGTETVTATFNPGPGTFPLTVVAGTPHTGGGTITSAPTGITCTLVGITTSGTCTNSFPAGTLVNLTSAPGGGSNFFGWTGTTPNCLSSSAINCVVGMSAATTVDAEFTSGGATVMVTVTGPGTVKDTANTGAINCTNTVTGPQVGTCTFGYPLGTPITLTETPTGTATFTPPWGGGFCANPTATTCAFTVTTASTAYNIAATFAAANTATHFSVSAPATATAGTAFNFTVTALDASNATVTGYAGTVHFTSSDGQATLPANATLTNGVGTFSATLKSSGPRTITATDTVTAAITGTSSTINLSSAAATHFTVSAPTTATSGTAFNFTVGALDPFNNTATGYTGTAHFTSTDGAATLPANSTLTNGVGTFSATLKTTGSQTITATDTVTAAITGTSAGITVSGAVATHFTVSAPATATAGTVFNFTVTALDGSNNTATGYTGTVHFTSSDGAATLPANSTLTNGVGTFSATLKTSGARTITATDTVTVSITGTSGTITVSAAAATHLSVSAPASATTGTAFNFTVTALDQFNNIATAYAGIVHFTSSDGAATLPANSTLTNGVGTFSATLKTNGSQSITATDTVTASITGTSGVITIASAGTATHFAVSAPGTATAGLAFNFTVTALDGSNNTATGYTGTVHFTSSDGAATLPANSTLTSGVGTFSVTLKTSGPRTITATDTVTAAITGTSGTITVNATAATHFTVSAPATAISGTAFNFTVTALDQFNNTATGYPGTAHFTSTDGAATLPANSTLTNGVGTFSATLNTAGPQTITATDSETTAITGTSGTITVSSPAATHFTVSAPATATAGTAISITVTALTASNTTATGYTGTVHFASSDGNAVLPANSTLTNGVGTFSVTLNSIGAQTVTATDTKTASITGTSGTITVSSVATAQLVVQTAGTGAGTVTGAGINCVSGSTAGCTANFAAGTQVQLTAMAGANSAFTSWSAICPNTTSLTCTFTMPETATMVTATFTLNAPTLKSIAVTPANPTVPINSTQQFTATGTFSDNSTKDLTTTATWASSNTEAATINATGLATTGPNADSSTTISATLNEVTGSTLLTLTNSPITISVTPPPGGSFPPVPPGGRLAVGIVLTAIPGFSGTVTFSCATSSPTITCQPDPASVTLTPGGPTDVAIVLNTFCTANTAPLGPTPGGSGGGLGVLLLGLMLGGVVLTIKRRDPRWALSFAVLTLIALGGAACASLPKSPTGTATPPGKYSVTFSATVNGTTTTTPPINFTVE
jgi:hypothetical protein